MSDQFNVDASSQTGAEPTQSQVHPLDAKRDDGLDCVSQDHPDPLVSDCDDLLRKDLSEELEKNEQESTRNPNLIGQIRQKRK